MGKLKSLQEDGVPKFLRSARLRCAQLHFRGPTWEFPQNQRPEFRPQNSRALLMRTPSNRTNNLWKLPYTHGFRNPHIRLSPHVTGTIPLRASLSPPRASLKGAAWTQQTSTSRTVSSEGLDSLQMFDTRSHETAVKARIPAPTE